MNRCAVVPQLAVVAGRPVTTSLNVAEVFGKNHQHVLRTIKALDVPEEFGLSNFGQTSYLDSQGRPQPMFNVTRDGFTILVMGFSGSKAMQFKLAYLAEFNRMETELHALAEFGNPASNLSTGPAPVTVARLAEAAQGIKAAMIMARGLGYRNAQAVKIANNLVLELTGIDALELLGPLDGQVKAPALPLAVDQPPVGRVDEKTLAEFIAAECELDAAAVISGADLFRLYCAWLRARQGNEWVAPTLRQFNQLMSRHFRSRRTLLASGGSGTVFHGLRLAGEELVKDPTLHENFITFLESCCQITPNWRTGATEAYDSFKAWWLKNVDAKPPSQKRFGDLMTERFDKSTSSGRVVYLGVALVVRAEEVNHG